MGQIENMNPKDVSDIADLIKALNEKKSQLEPPMTLKTFPMEDLEFSKRLTAIEEKLDSLIGMISHIFGGAILINGQFKELKIPQ